MAMFVHLTPEKNLGRIRRSGIKVSKVHGNKPNGVFAMPVVPNFYVSHQWLRELKAYGQRTLYGVYFRLRDEEPVYIGHYNSVAQQMSAGQALDLVFGQASTIGYEVTVPRKVMRQEIHKIRYLPQGLGWRYHPDVRQATFCGCPVCVRPGTVRSKVKNRTWEVQQ